MECDSDLEQLRGLLSFLVQRRVSTETFGFLRKARVSQESATAFADNRAQKEAREILIQMADHAGHPDHECSKEDAEQWLLTLEIQKELILSYDRGVCCFSTTWKSPVLWSHYGDQHRGLCLGFSLDRDPKPQIHRAIYCGNRGVKTSVLVRAFVEGDPSAKSQIDQDVLLRKARGWSYEKEWRLIGDEGLQSSPLLLKDVTFGLRVSASVVHSVVQSISGRQKPVKFYEIFEVPGNYQLKRRAVDLDEIGRYLPVTAESGFEAFPDTDDN
ncbi:DUF2971 domain-containing protein [Luteolibacter flavescens]|uniref:DUF2971 domain-containing protein n=1 Tax=Luteolibacter flavescens TaxID=1859460 RepID=A0ABT3FTS5_9BACT|nr:DUF2971 domain-containing protein [Luteolibacter flavescens]MCW1886965.1 DUF2971 domain-containing protein [Luteolibacter flavescens]